jgi:thioredoxin 1
MKLIHFNSSKTFIRFVILISFILNLHAQNSSDTLETKNKKHIGLTVDEFNKLIQDKFILVYLHADWCAICKKQQPILDKIVTEENGRLEFLDLDTEVNPLMYEHFEVDGLPRIILYKNGAIVWQYLGLIQENALRDWIHRY